jgi:hypothetical protein
MHRFKLGISLAVVALCAIAAGNASAAQFTYSATGNIVGKALESQSFTTNAGASLTCSAAAGAGAIKTTAFTEQEMGIKFSGCTSFGFATVDTTELKLLYTASGSVHLKSAFTVTPTLFGTSLCTVTYPTQTVGTVAFANSGTSNLKVTPSISGLTYTSSGGTCGSSGTNGTFKGASEWSREGGGTIRFDT